MQMVSPCTFETCQMTQPYVCMYVVFSMQTYIHIHLYAVHSHNYTHCMAFNIIPK